MTSISAPSVYKIIFAVVKAIILHGFSKKTEFANSINVFPDDNKNSVFKVHVKPVTLRVTPTQRSEIFVKANSCFRKRQE